MAINSIKISGIISVKPPVTTAICGGNNLKILNPFATLDNVRLKILINSISNEGFKMMTKVAWSKTSARSSPKFPSIIHFWTLNKETALFRSDSGLNCFQLDLMPLVYLPRIMRLKTKSIRVKQRIKISRISQSNLNRLDLTLIGNEW